MRLGTHSVWTAFVLVGLLVPVGASGQSRWTVEANSSLAWWQINPTMGHLWATTCPGDPGWRPGAGFSSGWSFDPSLDALPRGWAGAGQGSTDTVHVPLFPRYDVRHVCTEAVRGEFTVDDSVHWSGLHGWVAVRSADLVTGEQFHDMAMRRALGASSSGSEIRVTVDSVVDMTRAGDTLVGKAAGNMALNGTSTPMLASVRAFPDSGGMRVVVKWRLPAKTLYTITPSLAKMSLGLDFGLWKDLFMGADLVLLPSKHLALGQNTPQ
jgi:hypothetical protein